MEGNFPREKLFLIGKIDRQIVRDDLPTKQQVLQVMLYHLRISKLQIRGSASLVAKEALSFWEKKEIPTQSLQRCIEKIEKLYELWRSVQKNAGKDFNKKKEDDFKQDIEFLFDIAKSPEFLTNLEPEKLAILESRREPSRVGVVKPVVEKEKTPKEIAAERELKLQKPLLRERSLIDDKVELEGSSGSSQNDTPGSTFSQELKSPEAGPSEPKKPRGSIHIINEKVVATLDKCAISDCNALRIISAVAEACGLDVNTLAILRTAIRNARIKLREKLYAKIKKIFSSTELQAAVLHWDGKLLPSLTGTEQVDRLAVIISSGECEKILSIPALESGTGLSQANVIYEVLQDWGLLDEIKALCCNTTASNLGSKNGTATLLEGKLERDLLYMPCRHHIFEIVLAGVFDELMSSSTGPDILLFKRFKANWDKIDRSTYTTGLEDQSVGPIIRDKVDDIHSFIVNILSSEVQPRDDYKELLLLCLVFIGKMPREEVKFYRPGGVSRARWMARAIYCLKIFAFRDQFPLTVREKSAITQICIFIVLIYIEAWFSATHAPSAPRNDLNLIKKLHSYKAINLKIAEIGLKKNSNHLWYLAPETASLAFFDENLSNETKEKMIYNLRNDELGFLRK